MLFNSFAFLIFLPIVFIFYWSTNNKYRWIVLLIASYYFYSGWGIWYALLLLCTTVIDFLMAQRIARSTTISERKLFLIISITCNLLVLSVFKYFTFFYNSGVYLSNHFNGTSFNVLHQLIIPVGLSFYTFQSIAYTIDVYRGEVAPEKNLGQFALFVSFFPQLLAGPIERFNHLMPQLKKRSMFTVEQLYLAIRIAVWGFFKKIVIGDRLAEIIDPVFSNVNAYSGSTLLLAGFLFIIQVYCDFSGYSDIATGVAKLFGVDLCLNWKRPLLSKSFIEFWTRHHISLTVWFRNYLYIPLGGNKVGYNRWLLNVFIVFIISGLWHGAGWNFVLWGAMHGVIYVIELIVKKRFPNSKFPLGLGHLYLLLFHTFSLIIFRSQSIEDIGLIYYKIATSFNIENLSNELSTIKDNFPLMINLALIAFLFIKEIQEEHPFINSKSNFYSTYLRPSFYIILFTGIFLFGNFNSNPFIYFRF